MAGLFISYARKDKDEVYHIVEELEQYGFKCWIDRNGIESGDEFKEVILDAIDSCEVFLYMVSPNSAESEWCKKEYNYAKGEKKIIPVLLKGARQNRRLMFDFSLLDYIDYTNKSDKDKLVKELKSILNVTATNRENPLDDYISYLHNLAKEGDAEAQYRLVRYIEDEEMKLKLLEKSAEQGYIEAIIALVDKFIYSKGQNREMSTKWCKIGADLGDSYCQYLLGTGYYYGPEISNLSVEQDYIKAVEWLSKGTEQNDRLSQHLLARCYKNGTGVQQNYDKAIDLYTKVVDSIKCTGRQQYELDSITKELQLCKELKSEENRPLKRLLRRIKNIFSDDFEYII